jgi:hypothetical protein
LPRTAMPAPKARIKKLPSPGVRLKSERGPWPRGGGFSPPLDLDSDSDSACLDRRPRSLALRGKRNAGYY